MSADFLDSNILLYTLDEAEPRKRSISDELVQAALANGDATISFQVVQETLNVLTKKAQTPANAESARRFLAQVLRPLWRVMPSPELYERALELQSRYRYSFYDSLIIAAALEAGCSRLLSEDLHDGQAIEGLTIVNPFAPAGQ